jgi:hypothetical protein
LSGNLAACEARAQARSFLENDRLIDTGDIITGHRETCNNKVGRTVWALMTNLAPLRAPNNVPARSIVRVVQQKAIGACDEPIVPVVSNAFMSADNLRPRHDTERRKTRSRFPLRQREHCRVARKKSLHVHIRCIVDIRRPATTSGFRRAWRHLSDQTAPRRRTEEAAIRQVCACTAWGRRRDPFRGARSESAKFPCRRRNRSCKQDRSKSSASNTVPSAAHRQMHPESRPRRAGKNRKARHLDLHKMGTVRRREFDKAHCVWRLLPRAPNESRS